MELCKEKMTIVQGEKVVLTLRIAFENNLKAYDLTGATEIKFCIEQEDGNVLEKTLTGGAVVVTDAVLGELTVTLESADTLLLKDCDDQSFDIEVTKPAEMRIAKFERLLNVEKRICT